MPGPRPGGSPTASSRAAPPRSSPSTWATVSWISDFATTPGLRATSAWTSATVSLATVGGTPVDLVTADLSFISVIRALPVLTGDVAHPGASVVVLVKPQFEAGRIEASRARGVIRDPEVHRRTLGEVADALGGSGAVIMGAMPSPIRGSTGNTEFLLHARTPRPASGLAGPDDPPPGVRSLVDAAVAEAHDGPRG